MEQSPYGEANSLSASQETVCILWNLKVHYHIYKSLPPFPILSHSIQSLLPQSYFLQIIVMLLHIFAWCLQWSLSWRFPTQMLYALLTSPFPHKCHIPSLSHSDHEAPHYAIFSTPLLPHLF